MPRLIALFSVTILLCGCDQKAEPPNAPAGPSVESLTNELHATKAELAQSQIAIAALRKEVKDALVLLADKAGRAVGKLQQAEDVSKQIMECTTLKCKFLEVNQGSSLGKVATVKSIAIVDSAGALRGQIVADEKGTMITIDSPDGRNSISLEADNQGVHVSTTTDGKQKSIDLSKLAK
jgi:hypothetical protein